MSLYLGCFQVLSQSTTFKALECSSRKGFAHVLDLTHSAWKVMVHGGTAVTQSVQFAPSSSSARVVALHGAVVQTSRANGRWAKWTGTPISIYTASMDNGREEVAPNIPYSLCVGKWTSCALGCAPPRHAVFLAPRKELEKRYPTHQKPERERYNHPHCGAVLRRVPRWSNVRCHCSGASTDLLGHTPTRANGQWDNVRAHTHTHTHIRVGCAGIHDWCTNDEGKHTHCARAQSTERAPNTRAAHCGCSKHHVRACEP
jgi:hypothetical protein